MLKRPGSVQFKVKEGVYKTDEEGIAIGNEYEYVQLDPQFVDYLNEDCVLVKSIFMDEEFVKKVNEDRLKHLKSRAKEKDEARKKNIDEPPNKKRRIDKEDADLEQNAT